MDHKVDHKVDPRWTLGLWKVVAKEPIGCRSVKLTVGDPLDRVPSARSWGSTNGKLALANFCPHGCCSFIRLIRKTKLVERDPLPQGCRSVVIMRPRHVGGDPHCCFTFFLFGVRQVAFHPLAELFVARSRSCPQVGG